MPSAFLLLLHHTCVVITILKTDVLPEFYSAVQGCKQIYLFDHDNLMGRELPTGTATMYGYMPGRKFVPLSHDETISSTTYHAPLFV